MKNLPKNFLEGGAGLSKGNACPADRGGPSVTLRDVLESVSARYATVADVQALPLGDLNGTIAVGSVLYTWVPTSLANDSSGYWSIRPNAIDALAPGRFESTAQTRAMSFATSYQTADATVLFTVPAGFRMAIERVYHRISTGYVDAAGRVGASSSNAAYATPGDLIGGAAGDAAAALTAGVRGGTLGTAYGSNGVVELSAGDTIRWDVIAAGYTAGAGELVVIATRS